MLKDKDAKVTARSFGAGFLAKNANQVHAKTDVCRKDAVQNHIPADTKAWDGNIVWQSRILGGVSRFHSTPQWLFIHFLIFGQSLNPHITPKKSCLFCTFLMESFCRFCYLWQCFVAFEPMLTSKSCQPLGKNRSSHVI
jgi:hypothetical protein